MERNRYKGVVEAIEAAGDLSTLKLVKLHEDLAGRAIELEEIFLAACASHQEAAADKYLTWLLRAIIDKELIPLTTEEGSARWLITGMVNGDWSLIEEAKKRSAKVCAEKMAELYQKLPVSLPYKEQVWSDSVHRHVDVTRCSPTLLGIRKRMLQEVSVGWKAADEKEAQELFKVLTDAASNCSFEEQNKMTSEVLREATDCSVPAERRLSALLALWDRSSDKREFSWSPIARTVALGWARAVNPAELIAHIKVTLPLWGKGEEIFKIAEVMVARIAALSTDINAMVSAVFNTGYREKPTIVYSEMSGNKIQVEIKETVGWRYTQEVSEEVCHAHFDEKKRQLISWLDEHKLKAIIIWKYEVIVGFNKDKPIFSRSAEIKQ